MNTLSHPANKNIRPEETNDLGRALREPTLRQVDYPMGLRDASSALTYVDGAGNTYLKPVLDHDFDASIRLEETGLGQGRTVFGDQHRPIAIKYSAETDLVTMPAIFNASVEIEQGLGDIVEATVQAGLLLAAVKKNCGFVPSGVSLDDFAIDRSTGTAELLPPFSVDIDQTVESAFESLKIDAINRSAKQEQVGVLESTFAAAHRHLGW